MSSILLNMNDCPSVVSLQWHSKG